MKIDKSDRDHPYNIHIQVRKYREERQMTLAQLSNEAVISLSTLVKIESGAIDNPRINTLFNLAYILEMSVDDLIGLNQKPRTIRGLK